jgi:hypothetical protein
MTKRNGAAEQLWASRRISEHMKKSIFYALKRLDMLDCKEADLSRFDRI